MATTPAQRRALEKVQRHCAELTDARSLRSAVLEAIRPVVAFDAYVWLLTDPETTVGISPFARIPDLTELPTLIRLKYASTQNRWTSLDGVATVDIQDTRPAKATWQSFLSHAGIGHVASLGFKDRFGYWGWLDLWRTRESGPFTTSESNLLGELIDPVAAALRARNAASFASRSGRSDPAGPVVMLLSPDLRVLHQTPSAIEFLKELLPTQSGRDPIPAAAYNIGAQLLANEAGVDEHPPLARMYVGDGAWVTMRAGRLAGGDDADIAVTIEAATPSDRLMIFGRSYGLTPRESELLGSLATGVSTKEIAAQLFLAEHTVQDHLKSIFAKTGCHSRAEVLSKATG